MGVTPPVVDLLTFEDQLPRWSGRKDDAVIDTAEFRRRHDSYGAA